VARGAPTDRCGRQGGGDEADTPRRRSAAGPRSIGGGFDVPHRAVGSGSERCPPSTHWRKTLDSLGSTARLARLWQRPCRGTACRALRPTEPETLGARLTLESLLPPSSSDRGPTEVADHNRNGQHRVHVRACQQIRPCNRGRQCAGRGVRCDEGIAMTLFPRSSPQPCRMQRWPNCRDYLLTCPKLPGWGRAGSRPRSAPARQIPPSRTGHRHRTAPAEHGSIGSLGATRPLRTRPDRAVAGHSGESSGRS